MAGTGSERNCWKVERQFMFAVKYFEKSQTMTLKSRVAGMAKY